MPFVYFIHEEISAGNEPKVFKIGKTSQHPGDRCEQLQTGNPRKLVIYRWIETADEAHSKIEEQLHIENSGTHIRGEWFYISRDAVDIACAMILSVYLGTSVSSDYPTWTEEDILTVQEKRVVIGKYRGGKSPRTARKKKKEFWDAKAQPMRFSDE